MAEQLLDETGIGTGVHQRNRAGVPQNNGADLLQPSPIPSLADDSAEGFRGEGTAMLQE